MHIRRRISGVVFVPAGVLGFVAQVLGQTVQPSTTVDPSGTSVFDGTPTWGTKVDTATVSFINATTCPSGDGPTLKGGTLIGTTLARVHDYQPNPLGAVVPASGGYPTTQSVFSTQWQTPNQAAGISAISSTQPSWPGYSVVSNVAVPVYDYGSAYEGWASVVTDYTYYPVALGGSSLGYQTMFAVQGTLHLVAPKDLSFVNLWIDAPSYAVPAFSLFPADLGTSNGIRYCLDQSQNNGGVYDLLALGTTTSVAGLATQSNALYGVTFASLTPRVVTTQPSTSPATQPTTEPSVAQAVFDAVNSQKEKLFSHDGGDGDYNDQTHTQNPQLEGFQWRRDVLDAYTATEGQDQKGLADAVYAGYIYTELPGSWDFDGLGVHIHQDITDALHLACNTFALFMYMGGAQPLPWVRATLEVFLMLGFLWEWLCLVLWGAGVAVAVDDVPEA